MDKAEQTMLDNLHKGTGISLEGWIELVREKSFNKHGEIMNFLKEEKGLTHGFANLIALKSRAADAGSTDDKEELIEKQYKGKEHFKPIYAQLISEIKVFGDDIEVAPKNANVSLRRKKQFAVLEPKTKTRFEIGINLKGQEPQGKLEPSGNAMCTHKINITELEDIDGEVLGWLRKAYDNAG